jgi:hypothetical protein
MRFFRQSNKVFALAGLANKSLQRTLARAAAEPER